MNITLYVAFAAGLLSFLSPCVLPLLPGYVANLAGTAAAGGSWNHRARRPLGHSILFVAGFALVFTSLGALAGLLGLFSSGYAPFFRKAGGVLMILLGIHMIGLVRIPFLYREVRLNPSSKPKVGFLRSFGFGFAFGLGWTPCVGPVLAGILALAWDSQTAWQGVSFLGAYSLGLGAPFIALSLALGPATRYLGFLQRHARLVSVISGLLLIALGILMFTDQLARLSGGIGL